MTKLGDLLTIPTILAVAIFFQSCKPQPASKYDQLLGYEGTYEYIGNTTLDIIVSDLDSTLYALIDNAKYPLAFSSVDTFSNVQGTAVIFYRTEDGQVSGYQVNAEKFALIDREVRRQTMIPRKELLGQSENYRYVAPSPLTDGLETGSIQEAFENPEALIDMIKETIKGNYPDVHSILIMKNDRLVLEEYFYDYDQNTPHQLRSATKPFIGGVMGIAMDQGFIKSEEDGLYQYFKDRYPDIEITKDKEKITIEDFLTYRHGLDCENDNPESLGSEAAMMQSEDWVKYTLDLPVKQDPGTITSYCTGCSLTIGQLVEVATGGMIEDFARENLFAPMGITNYKWKFEANPKSITTFSQMYLTPRDLVKLASMFKNGGTWNDQQIISKSWVDKTFDNNNGAYGYLWLHRDFTVNGKTYNSYLATGNGGQKISIWPELDMITVFTGGNYNSYQLYGKSTPPNEMIPKYVLAALNKPVP